MFLGNRPVDAVQFRTILQRQGIIPPEVTGATYDVTTEGREGLRFHLTLKWAAAAAATIAAVVAAIVLIIFAARSIALELPQHHDQTVGLDMATIACAVVYAAAVVVVYWYAVGEKYRSVNRFNARTWIGELRRINRLARRPATDAEIEDAALDRAAAYDPNRQLHELDAR